MVNAALKMAVVVSVESPIKWQTPRGTEYGCLASIPEETDGWGNFVLWLNQNSDLSDGTTTI